jgi:CHAD domain-containing protein
MAQSNAAALLRYFDAVETKFRRGTEQAHDFFAVEGIHDLRVEIKRLRAFFKLVGFLRPEFNSQADMKLLKPLFGVAGQLRDIDIQQGIVFEGLERHELSEYANELKQLEFALRPALVAAIESYQGGRLKESRRKVTGALKAMSADEIHDGLARRIRQLVDELMPLISMQSVSDVELHKTRKLSKASRYTLDIWHLVARESSTSSQASASLKEVYTHLGTWHDARVTAESLGRFLGRGAPRNLFDPAAYRKFAGELAVTETACLTQYQMAAKKLAVELGRLTATAPMSPKVTSPRTMRRRGRTTESIAFSPQRKQPKIDRS